MMKVDCLCNMLQARIKYQILFVTKLTIQLNICLLVPLLFSLSSLPHSKHSFVLAVVDRNVEYIYEVSDNKEMHKLWLKSYN